jgi:hypothetical protein
MALETFVGSWPLLQFFMVLFRLFRQLLCTSSRPRPLTSKPFPINLSRKVASFDAIQSTCWQRLKKGPNVFLPLLLLCRLGLLICSDSVKIVPRRYFVELFRRWIDQLQGLKHTSKRSPTTKRVENSYIHDPATLKPVISEFQRSTAVHILDSCNHCYFSELTPLK